MMMRAAGTTNPQMVLSCNRGDNQHLHMDAQEEGNTMFNHSYIVLSHSFQSSTPTVLYNTCTCTRGDVHVVVP